jgi:hypothetical protein
VQSFREGITRFIDFRYGALHFLNPVLTRQEFAFFTNGNDLSLQRMWARENGLSANASVTEILLAQIEHHRTEVFYNLDPVRFDTAFLKKLPGCVKKKICWRAAPYGRADFGGYDLVVCNFPSILESFRSRGWRAAEFMPAHDPVMDDYAARDDRPIDVIFVGTYSRHHARRAEILESIAKLRGSFRVSYFIHRSALTRMCDSVVGFLPYFRKMRSPPDIKKVANPPIFGRDVYEHLSSSKVVLNAAIDMAGEDRGNMRCFEAMGCRSLLLSDNGRYPSGMRDGYSMLTYCSPREAARKVVDVLSDKPELQRMADAGYKEVSSSYGKEKQWQEFCRLID